MSDGSNLPHPPSDDEIAERLRKAVERATGKSGDSEDPFLALKQELDQVELPNVPEGSAPKVTLPEDDPDFAERMRRLEQRAQQSQERRDVAAAETRKSMRQDRENTYSLGVGLTIAYMFLGFPLIGALIGLGIGKLTGAAIAMPAGGFIGMIVGCILAFKALSKANQS